MKRRTRGFAIWSASLVLVGCGGGDGTVGGTLTGLGDGLSVVLQDNAASSLTLKANGTFSFASTLAAGGTYSVSVLTQPTGETCTVSNGSGTVDALGTNVTSVAVACVASASITGTVTGLAPGTSLTLTNGTTRLTIAADGAFAFPGLLPSGTAYSVAVAVTPAGETCTLTNAAGTTPADGVVTVTVACR